MWQGRCRLPRLRLHGGQATNDLVTVSQAFVRHAVPALQAVEIAQRLVQQKIEAIHL